MYFNVKLAKSLPSVCDSGESMAPLKQVQDKSINISISKDSRLPSTAATASREEGH